MIIFENQNFANFIFFKKNFDDFFLIFWNFGKNVESLKKCDQWQNQGDITPSLCPT